MADGAWYRCRPLTPGFSAPRIPAAAMSIGLAFGSNLVAWGDAMSVQYAGNRPGREGVFDPVGSIPHLLSRSGPEASRPRRELLSSECAMA